MRLFRVQELKGVKFVSLWHYSGTFWAASCDYINSMRPIKSTWCRQANMEYNCAEFWIGSGMEETLQELKFVDLHPGFTTDE